MKLLSFLTALLLSFLNLPAARQPSTSAPQSPQRDSQAVSILTQSINAIGGQSRVGAIQDFTGTGTIAYNWVGKEVPGSVSVYGKGLEEFRMDAAMFSGTQSLVVNGTAATLVPLGHPKTKLSVYSVMTAGSLTFPATRIASVLSDSSIGVSYLGSVTWNGSQVYLVHVVPPLDPAFSAASTLSGLGEYDLYVDPATYQLAGFAEKVWWGNDLTQSYLHELTFSNYTATNGLSVPFAITEKFGGQHTWSITLRSLTFNTGLSDTFFAP
jgi:hypothetical protein